MVGRARLADDVDEVRRVSQRIDLGNMVLRSWVESLGGSLTEMAGDEGAAMVPADHLDELPGIVEQYAGKVGATVSIGIGMKLSEASKALLAAKLQGKARIVFYSEEVDQIIAEAEKHRPDEAEKIKAEYLNKTVPGSGERMEHYRPHHEAVDPSVKVDHLGEHQGFQVYLVDGDKIRHTIDADFTMGGNPGRYKYVPEGEIWVDSNTNLDEIPEVIDHEARECAGMERRGDSYEGAHDAANRAQFAKAAPAMNAGAFAGASRPSGPTVGMPVATQGEHSEGRAIRDVVEASGAPAPPEQTHAAEDFERQLHEEAWKGEEEDAQAAAQKHSNLAQIKQQVAQALQVLKVQAPVVEQLRQVAPEAHRAISSLVQAVVALAREASPAQPMQKAESLGKFERAGEYPARLVHFSTTSGLRRIGVRHMGTGAPSAEYKQGVPDVARAYYYREGSQPEALVTTASKAKYIAILDPHKHRLYDLTVDPERLAEGARQKFLSGKGLSSPTDTLLADVKKRGYYGYYSGRMPHVVALFYPHPVEEVPNDSTAHIQKDGPKPLAAKPVTSAFQGPCAAPGCTKPVMAYGRCWDHLATPVKRLGKAEGDKVAKLVEGVRAVLSDDLLKPEYKGAKGCTAGHCYVANEALYHLLGGQEAGWTPHYILHEGGPHWYLRHSGGRVVDPASDQFETPVPYIKGRGKGFLTALPSKRAQQVIERMVSEGSVKPGDLAKIGLQENPDAGMGKEELKTEGEPHEPPKDGAELEKARLPMPGAPAHHHLNLPSGSTLGNRVKVTHQDGSTSWKRVGAGMILGQDPAHHPVSSREPNSR